MNNEHGTSDQPPIDPDLAPDDTGEPSPGHRPTQVPIHRGRDHLTIVAIATGGFIGTLARYLAGLRWPTEPGTFPVTTFAVNTSGAFALGLVLTTLLMLIPSSRRARLFICTGVIGGWTTMSTLAVELVLLIDDNFSIALAYATATVIAGLVAGTVGVGLSHRIFRRST